MQTTSEIKTQEKPRLFIDMDGTLAKFQPVDTLETLYERGYFANLEPNERVVEAVKKFMEKQPDIEAYIMSAVLSDSKYALAEKNAWLDKFLPDIDASHRIFPPCGDSKLAYVPGRIKETDYLLDDYTHNLILWEPPARGIKLLNGINHTKGTWTGNMLRFDKRAADLADNIISIMHGEHIQDIRPQEQRLVRKLSTTGKVQPKSPRR